MFTIITKAKQAEFEAKNENSAEAKSIPDICGYCGRACRQMEKEEGANRAICTHCPLAEFCKEETRQEKTNRENEEHCKGIANKLKKVASGNMYKCPKCGEIIEYDNEHQGLDEDENIVYTCQCCGETFLEYELEAVSMYDYFNDAFDIEYTIGSDKKYKSVRIMVACGGPNIYIDTREKAVLLYWWSDRAQWYLSDEAVDAIDEVFKELYSC